MLRKLVNKRSTMQLAGGALLALTLGISCARAAQPLRVATSTWVGYGLLYLADKEGLFKKEGVDVNLQTIDDKPSTAAAISTGRIDGWATTVDTFIFYNASRLGIKQVIAVDQSAGGEGIAATAGIKTVADLKGKTIGAEEGSSTYFFLLNVLNDAGLTSKDVNLQSMRAADAGTAFFAGRLDAAATWDPWFAKAKERDGAHDLVDSRSRPGLVVDTVAFSNEVIKNRPADVNRFIKAYLAAYDMWKADPDKSNKVMADALGMKLDEFTKSLAGIEYMSKGQNVKYIGTPTTAGQIESVIANGGKMYMTAGLIKALPNAKAMVDATPLTQVVQK